MMAFVQYFEHEKSKAKFRSVTEVIKFILHGAYPKNKQNSKQGKLEERSAGKFECLERVNLMEI